MPGQDLHTLLIEKLVPGGFGLGRLNSGIVVMVRYVLPGEYVLVREQTRKRDYVTATLVEVLSGSEDRIKPPCPVYGRCGGCDLQHAGPEAQLRLKKAILADILQRTAGDIFAGSLPMLESPLAAPEQFGYRQRLRFQVDSRGDFGFYRPESHDVEPVSGCPLGKDALNTVLRRLHTLESFRGLIRHCTAFELLYNPAENGVVLLLHFRRKARPADTLLAADLAANTTLSAILMQVEGYGLYNPLERTFLASPPSLSHALTVETKAPSPQHAAGNKTVFPARTELNLSWEAGGFCQVNLAQNSNLVALVLEMAAAGRHNRVLDLYCGYGNFSLPLAQFAGEVFGIDSQNSAIRSAVRNAAQNDMHNCRFAKNRVASAVHSLIAAGRTFETIILDPPRQGASEIVSMLPELGAEQIIYISCNPATQARDLASLLQAGYRLSRLVPVDMFPQTHHLESVALLKRSNRN